MPDVIMLDLLPTPLAIVRSFPDLPVPDWVSDAREFVSITRTPTELSIVCDRAAVPVGLRTGMSYLAFRVRGPLPLSLVGVFAALATPLAAAAIPIFPIATHDTDYLLVPAEVAEAAARVLTQAGHPVTTR